MTPAGASCGTDGSGCDTGASSGCCGGAGGGAGGSSGGDGQGQSGQMTVPMFLVVTVAPTMRSQDQLTVNALLRYPFLSRSGPSLPQKHPSGEPPCDPC
jgi:hypothetical protein